MRDVYINDEGTLYCSDLMDKNTRILCPIKSDFSGDVACSTDCAFYRTKKTGGITKNKGQDTWQKVAACYYNKEFYIGEICE